MRTVEEWEADPDQDAACAAALAAGCGFVFGPEPVALPESASLIAQTDDQPPA